MIFPKEIVTKSNDIVSECFSKVRENRLQVEWLQINGCNETIVKNDIVFAPVFKQYYYLYDYVYDTSFPDYQITTMSVRVLIDIKSGERCISEIILRKCLTN